MGLFNFWKTSGKSLAEDQAVPTADALIKEVSGLGLDTKGAAISVAGDKVRITGETLTGEGREKVILAVGNVVGVAEAEDDLTDAARCHTVEKGETLSAIAKKTLGNANRFGEIFRANKAMLSHSDKIYAGQAADKTA